MNSQIAKTSIAIVEVYDFFMAGKMDVLRLLRPGESNGGEESNGKLPHNAKNNQDPTPGSPDAWTKQGTHFTHFYYIAVAAPF
ncbi:hypothetical protein PoB_002792900 [Plakobranchus ocellatus]|uniref:Uncharacterized protein n=1 Tax=Plakobranchus ocellatus TaxID=259542 RepID=A0AAV4A5B2_9GAST|nr:hypothetical protein PoB_002792900 [Plakobranchus ocellatus]